MAIMGTTLAVAGDLRLRHGRADGRVGAAVLRHAESSRRSPPSARPSPTPARTSPRCARAPSYDEATDEWVLNGQKAWATNGGIADVHVVVASVDPELGSRGQAAFVDPAGHAGPRDGHEGQEARPARLAHRRRLPRRLPRSPAACLLGGKEKLDERLARAREGQRSQRAGRDAHVRGARARRSARRRSASRARRTSTRSTTPRTASSSASRSSRTRRSRSCSPT